MKTIYTVHERHDNEGWEKEFKTLADAEKYYDELKTARESGYVNQRCDSFEITIYEKRTYETISEYATDLATLRNAIIDTNGEEDDMYIVLEIKSWSDYMHEDIKEIIKNITSALRYLENAQIDIGFLKETQESAINNQKDLLNGSKKGTDVCQEIAEKYEKMTNDYDILKEQHEEIGELYEAIEEINKKLKEIK